MKKGEEEIEEKMAPNVSERETERIFLHVKTVDADTENGRLREVHKDEHSW